jgi:CheY-like chemotaxis protein
VEDDRDYRFVLRLCLDRLGYDVVEACDGAEAVQQYLRCDADAILTDIFMPEMDGVELIRELQTLRPNLPIVAFSGAVRSDQSGVTTCGAHVPLLSKPVDLKQLSAALLRALGDPGD